MSAQPMQIVGSDARPSSAPLADDEVLAVLEQLTPPSSTGRIRDRLAQDSGVASTALSAGAVERVLEGLVRRGLVSHDASAKRWALAGAANQAPASGVREHWIRAGRIVPPAQVKPRSPLVWLDSPPTLRIDPERARHLHWTLEDTGIGPDLATLSGRRTP